VAELYRALAAGSDHDNLNPLFYVSNSAWNLYDLLRHFLQINDLPTGPLLLRDLTFNVRDANKRDHKKTAITRLMQRYSSKPAILIGDAGQHDAGLYAEIANEFPGRVLAIYIRDVDPGIDSPYDAKVDTVIDKFSHTKVPMVRAEDSRAFAEHMHSVGLLSTHELQAVAKSAARDDQRGFAGQ
jgi:phosphatidate phosphatase APP1